MSGCNRAAGFGLPQAASHPLKIGAATLPNRAFLAPMAGITDAPVRLMAERLGAGLVVSEMIAAGWLVGGAEEARLRAEGVGVRCHAVQLAGREPDALADAARIAEAAGAAIIDINMGCPARAVTTGAAGAALMRDLDLAERLISAVTAATDRPVTVKMRLGWDARARVAPELARRAEAAGAAAVTVHGRTRDQFYDGRADWSAIAEVKAAVTIPVIANGDIATDRDARDALALSGADAVMIGRAARGRPWRPGRIADSLNTGAPCADPPLPEQHALTRELFEGLLSHHGLPMGLRIARKHLGWAIAAAAETAGADDDVVRTWRKRVLTQETPALVLDALASAFDALAWRAAA